MRSTPGCPPRCGREMFALYTRAGDQSVREDDRPRRRSNRTSTNTTSSPTAATISISSRTAFSTSMRTIRAAATRSRSVRCIRRRPKAADRIRGFCYTIRRLPRRRTVEEQKYGTVVRLHRHRHVHLAGRARRHRGRVTAVAELSVRALCSNRHLTEHLPVGEGGADFRLLDDVDARRRLRRRTDAAARAGGRRSCAAAARPRTPATVTWRLINMLSLNHLGLVERGARQERTVAARVLSLFADLPDSATERKIRGVRSVDSRPVVRRVRQRSGSRRRARHRGHGHARRAGLRGKRRLPARRDPRPVLLPNMRRSITSRRPSSVPSSAARSCAGRPRMSRMRRPLYEL